MNRSDRDSRKGPCCPKFGGGENGGNGFLGFCPTRFFVPTENYFYSFPEPLIGDPNWITSGTGGGFVGDQPEPGHPNARLVSTIILPTPPPDITPPSHSEDILWTGAGIADPSQQSWAVCWRCRQVLPIGGVGPQSDPYGGMQVGIADFNAPSKRVVLTGVYGNQVGQPMNWQLEYWDASASFPTLVDLSGPFGVDNPWHEIIIEFRGPPLQQIYVKIDGIFFLVDYPVGGSNFPGPGLFVPVAGGRLDFDNGPPPGPGATFSPAQVLVDRMGWRF